MKKMYSLVFAVLVVAELVPFAAGGNPPQAGKIISENSVSCGSKKEGKKKETDLLCQEYVMRTATTEYHIRQPKPNNQAMLSPNSDVNFEIDKDKMKLKSGGKKYEFLVVSMAATTPEDKQ